MAHYNTRQHSDKNLYYFESLFSASVTEEAYNHREIELIKMERPYLNFISKR